jgi:hypothetical protein
MKKKKTIIHVNQHVVKDNVKKGNNNPVLTVKTYNSNDYAHEAVIKDKQGNEVARVIYRPDKPLSCGARVWIETSNDVELIQYPQEEPLDATTYCYKRLYEEATPKANFFELPYMDRESKFFLDYEIEESKLNEIIEETIKKFKIKRKIWKQAFINTILLGCSPKTKWNESKTD